MATFFPGESHTFSEYLLVPGYSSQECVPDNVSLKTPLTRFRAGEQPAISLNIPMTSAIMQSVSGESMGIALATEGGMSFIYGSQSSEDEAAMVKSVKDHKAGFVISDSTLTPGMTLAEVMQLKMRTGHSTMPVTDDGLAHGKLLGIVTSRDYRPSRDDPAKRVEEFMTPREKLIVGDEHITLKRANDVIWDSKLNALPVVDASDYLLGIVFRKDYDAHKTNPNELLDANKRYMVGAGINTRDYETRVPLLLDAGADVLCIDSSEGYSEWQKRTISWIHGTYGEDVHVGAGNVVDAEGFRFLADCGADFIKVGIGGGSICITRETKGIGRGQATALIDVCRARDEYFKEKGVYVPVCSDGGIVYDYHMSLALAMGADFMMLGRYFARFDESPTARVNVNGQYMKEYWGEGSVRARNWQRYDLGGAAKLSFEEGVDSYVPYAGSLKAGVESTLYKVKSTMCNCGALTIPELQQKARLTLVSSTSIIEGGAHDVVLKDHNQSISYR
ncbi:IMP dehydrogenase [Coriobacterium glomerans PW2]|uniref:IMP dehydrogenase n=1 Tax=Coriobacterium glomerans (strain ATCC 49209 / DSM 20642 / JCM 10262 / PW2) TaxID=700015 RepID=F2N9Q2_CORGP|nr:IMP dehydrogenase [Coriobacterium glomerans]AEB07155.1 IMP dehydrogenase [Coriobacterium glomerans PW2]